MYIIKGTSFNDPVSNKIKKFIRDFLMHYVPGRGYLAVGS